MKIGGIAPWFGSKRTMAPLIVQQLGKHNYYFGLCCGSLSVEFAKEKAHHETVCDLHGDLMNLAWILQDETAAVNLFNRCQVTCFDDELYRRSCEWLEGKQPWRWENSLPSLDWAYHYFVASWMGRNGVAGTERINYQIATRWTAGGGSGPLRFHSAVDSIPAWCERLRNIHVLKRDVFEVLPRIEDAELVSIYIDPPYIEEGDKYLHGFEADQHVRLAVELNRFEKARVVVSYYDHAAFPELYEGWTKLDCSRAKHLSNQNRRGQVRETAPEVLLINGPSFTAQVGSILFPSKEPSKGELY
jgi:DNA adenine methylase